MHEIALSCVSVQCPDVLFELCGSHSRGRSHVIGKAQAIAFENCLELIRQGVVKEAEQAVFDSRQTQTI